MTLEDGEHFDLILTQPIDDAVVANYDLPQLGPQQFGQWATAVALGGDGFLFAR